MIESTNPNEQQEGEPILEISSLEKHFSQSSGWYESLFGKKNDVKAVDGVDLSISRKEIVSIVGESGCGKTTFAKSLIRLIEPTSGSVEYRGEEITSMSDAKLKEMRRHIQMVHQDPFSSLNPKKKIYEILKQPLDIHNIGDESEKGKTVREALEAVGLTPVNDFIGRYPGELSGGQNQRVLFARSLVLDPDVIIADEPSSMLDAGLRSQILDLIINLRREQGITFLIITHDIGSARYLSDRIAVMYLGRLVEIGTSDGIVENPKHPYSRALIESIPSPNPHIEFESSEIEGELPEPTDIPSGCRFHPRCPIKKEHCESKIPERRSVPSDDGERIVECHEVEPKEYI